MNVRELIAELEKIKDKEKIVHVDCYGEVEPLREVVEDTIAYNDEGEQEEVIIIY